MRRSHTQIARTVLALLLGLALVPWLAAPGWMQGKVLVSSLGLYSGYSQPTYREWVRVSQYVKVRDGTRLAVDIFRPAEKGTPVSEPLPAIWTHHRYHRADVQYSKIVTVLAQMPWLQTLLAHGYVVAAVDVRGGGASFGKRLGEFAREEALDAYDITEWFATQPWCNGRVGMYGRSYLGVTQYMAASTAPPHLRAIFPEMALFDLYSFIYPGGVLRQNFVVNWGRLVRSLDLAPAAAVDADRDGQLLFKAMEEHQASADVFSEIVGLPHRDSKSTLTKSQPYLAWSPASYLEAIRQSGVAIYHLAGWYDMWPRDALVWFNNLDNPEKIAIGPWSHTDSAGLDLAAEHLRWYDYWLKGIDNGIMAEAPIHYYMMGAPRGKEWRSAQQWPLPKEKPTRYYLVGQAQSGSLGNGGLLGRRPPADATGQSDYIIDYTTTSGLATRWINGYGGPFGYPDMAPNDLKGLAYTTPPLASDLEVTGHPVIHLWVSASVKEVDFFVFLEEVDEQGRSLYITEGVLRASHRAVSTPPFNYLGLPYHRGLAEDLLELPSGEPVELVLDLYPTANLFDAGHRIRVTITCADRDNALTPEMTPAPEVSIYTNTKFVSYLILPVIPAEAK